MKTYTIEQLEERKNLLQYLSNPSNQEIYTPVKVVEEMLDKLPEEIWKDENKTWCDPCCKSGIFVLEVIIRLMKKLNIKNETLRYNHIINNMINAYGVNEKSKYIVAKTVYGNGNEIDKIKIIDLKREEKMLKFDVTLGNVPFQNGTDTTQKPLWPQFMDIATKITKDNGYIMFIVPKTWFNAKLSTTNKRKGSDLARTRMNNITPFNLLYLAIDTPKKYFNVGSDFCYYLINKSEHDDNILTTIEYLDNDKISFVKKQTNSMEIILPNQNSLRISIYNKIINSNAEKLEGDFHNPKGFQGSGHLKKYADDTYCYKCVSTSAQYKRGEFFYSKIEHPNMHRNKIIYSSSGYGNHFMMRGHLERVIMVIQYL